MADSPLLSKKTEQGVIQRIGLLEEFVPDLESVLSTLPRKCKMDDALDAFAAAWTAKRYVRGKSVIIGGRDYDEQGYPLRVII